MPSVHTFVQATVSVSLLVATASLAATPQAGARGPGAEDARTNGSVRHSPARPTIPREGPLSWGIYQILWRRDAFEHLLDREIERLGRPDYVTFFRDLGRGYPARVCEAVHLRGGIPIISFEIQHWGRGGNREALERVAAGAYDEFFARYAADAREAGHDVWFRFGFEMNGDWFTWGCQPARFIAAWKRVHAIFAREGADNVVWVWAPNAISGPDTEENGLERYWPGDDYVDVIGLDGYNFGDDYSEWHTWTSFADIFSPALEKIRRAGTGKPVFITEFGCTDGVAGPRRAQWIREAHAFLRQDRSVVGALWFNHDKRREGEKNWRIDADAASLAAWRETFARDSRVEDGPR